MSDDPKRKEPEPYARPRGQNFEVVMIRRGKNALTSERGDFLRVGVVADSPSEAMDDPAVAARAAEYVTYRTMTPGQPTEEEVLAARREHDKAMGPPVDRARI
jgi:hypothetical protein